MQKLSNSFFLNILTKVLILLAIAKVISLAIWWFLPSDGVELQVKKNYKPAYQRVDFKSMLISPSVAHAKKQAKKKTTTSSVNITNMILKGLYGKGTNGMAIVALKSSARKTSVVSVGEVFSGYVLKTILKNAVVFTKNKKEYTLNMGKPKNISKSVISPVTVETRTKTVARKDINDYIYNRKDIWKDIAIDALKVSGKIQGFKVKRVNKKSQLGTLGLQKGDLIVAANNIELKSYKDVLDIYKKIKELKTIQIIVLRDNQEHEFVYDIN
ncbi:hypothetical protein N9X61_00645 [Sulfurimonas sp.]|nr:hypothetical protein [Sulfurimonas sp.]